MAQMRNRLHCKKSFAVFQSVHSNAMEKNRMLYTLLQHGVETTVDRRHKTHRIINWIKQVINILCCGSA
jgi:hypothetical protein